MSLEVLAIIMLFIIAVLLIWVFFICIYAMHFAAWAYEDRHGVPPGDSLRTVFFLEALTAGQFTAPTPEPEPPTAEEKAEREFDTFLKKKNRDDES